MWARKLQFFTNLFINFIIGNDKKKKKKMFLIIKINQQITTITNKMTTNLLQQINETYRLFIPVKLNNN